MMTWKAAAILLCMALLAACSSIEVLEAPRAPQASSPPGPAVTEGIDTYMQQRLRVESVGFRLRRAAAPQCARQDTTRNDLGIVVWSLANFPNPEDRSRLQRLYNLTDEVTVALFIEGGPSQAAGLRPGAIITHVDGVALPAGQGATARFIAISSDAARSGPVNLHLRDGRTMAIAAQAVCAQPALLVRSPDINAATDGNALAITTALHGMLKSDDELAVILGHELGHILLGHTKPGSNPDRKREMDADRTGLELAAQAGFDISAAPALWSRLNRSKAAPALADTHPTGPEREAAIRRLVEQHLKSSN